MFLTLLPHGIIELLSVFIALSHSFKLGISYLLPSSKGNRMKTFIANLKKTPIIFIFAILGLTLSAIVEVLDMLILKVLVK
ncbi:hypothetical protein HGB13_04270 [bacterium]|nr:hypothetical protein [bacterium]